MSLILFFVLMFLDKPSGKAERFLSKNFFVLMFFLSKIPLCSFYLKLLKQRVLRHAPRQCAGTQHITLTVI